MKPQFIKTENGDELVVLPRRQYERLVRAGRDEDVATRYVIDRTKAAIADGHEMAIPADVAEAIARGGSEIRIVREWRGLTQADLAKRAGLTQGYISQLESGGSDGTPKAMRSIARVLRVPIDLIIPG
jgi:DNA-binding XRE family transcriptional regulator